IFSKCLLLADDEGLAKGAGAYLSMGVGARPLGMGNAFVAVADGSSSLYWNPAGLSQIRQHQTMLMSGSLGVDRFYNYLDYVYPLKLGDDEDEGTFASSWSFADEDREPSYGGIAVGWINFSVKNIEGRDDYGRPTGNFEDREDTFIVGYGKKIRKNFYCGTSFKYHIQKLEREKATGFSLDVGTMYKPTKQWSFGLSIQNIMGSLKWSLDGGSVKDDILLNIRLGGAYRPLKSKLLLALDVEKTLEQDVKLYLGSEYQVGKNICLRAGSSNFNPTIGTSLTLPLKIVKAKIDYAVLMDIQEDLSWTNRFSLRVTF
ncbi:PorV/PorQ family protein, partial [bacterium]|nr:PorV/PorQ family protein [bacterium]